MWHTYYTPTTLEETLRLLAQHGKDARIIAGGTDILIELERKIRAPQVLDRHLAHSRPRSHRVEERRASTWGRWSRTIRWWPRRRLVAQAYPLARACWEVGAPQIRNRGTIAGNLITASPANDTIVPLRALGATVTLQSVRGKRTLPLHDFYKGVRKTVMADDELLVDIYLPGDDRRRARHVHQVGAAPRAGDLRGQHRRDSGTASRRDREGAHRLRLGRADDRARA